MNSQKELPAIDNNLYQFHIDLQLRQLESDASVRLNEKEKLKTILTSLRGVDESKIDVLHSIFREIFDNSVDLRDVDDHVEQMDFTTIVDKAQDANIVETVDIEIVKPQENLEHADTSGQIKKDEEEKIIEVPKAKQRVRNGKPLFINSFQRLINNAAYEKPITDILLINPIREIEYIKSHTQRSCVIFRQRMMALNKSNVPNKKKQEEFDLKNLKRVFKKPMSEFLFLLRIRHQTTLNKCRQSLYAYQMGKLVDQLSHGSSPTEKETMEKSLFRDLNAAITLNKLSYNNLSGLCVKSVYVVKHIGVHMLFVPEVLSPSILKDMDKSSLVSLEKHLETKWPSQFKNLAQVNHNGELVVTEDVTDAMFIKKDTARYNGNFLNDL